MKIGRNQKNDDERKKHNDVSKKGREKINKLIDLLQHLLPANRYNPNKASVLQCAVQTIEKFKIMVILLQQNNQYLLDQINNQSPIYIELPQTQMVQEIPQQFQYTFNNNPNTSLKI